MAKTLTDFNRRNVNFKGAKIREVLPEHFQEEYPNIITFLEAYYDFQDSDADHNFAPIINSLLSARDIEDASLSNLNTLLKEIGLNTANINYFRDPRYVARLLANFYRVKGSTYSADGFFKAFYNTNVDISYPKNNIFIVSQSNIGPEELTFIQDGNLYQTYSILIKSELPKTIWEDLFKLFVHPAGFYLGSEVQITTNFNLNLDDQPIVTQAVDLPIYVSVSTSTITGISDITKIIPDTTPGTFIRTSISDTIASYATMTLEQLGGMYPDLRTIINVTSPTMDDSDWMNMSNTAETMDQVNYEWYDSDSA